MINLINHITNLFNKDNEVATIKIEGIRINIAEFDKFCKDNILVDNDTLNQKIMEKYGFKTLENAISARLQITELYLQSVNEAYGSYGKTVPFKHQSEVVIVET